MQVYVRKSSLSADPVRVVGYYEDAPARSRALHGDDCTVLLLPGDVVQINSMTPEKPVPDPMMQLKSSWKNNAAMICNGEAYRRIIEVFSEFMQRNATNDVVNSASKYGSDQSQWPQDAKDRKAEADRGWAYVSAVRQASDAMQDSLPTDPTDDSNWPTRIAPIYIPSA